MKVGCQYFAKLFFKKYFDNIYIVLDCLNFVQPNSKYINILIFKMLLTVEMNILLHTLQFSGEINYNLKKILFFIFHF